MAPKNKRKNYIFAGIETFLLLFKHRNTKNIIAENWNTKKTFLLVIKPWAKISFFRKIRIFELKNDFFENEGQCCLDDLNFCAKNPNIVLVHNGLLLKIIEFWKVLTRNSKSKLLFFPRKLNFWTQFEILWTSIKEF